jgi:hypothetical protein
VNELHCPVWVVSEVLLRQLDGAEFSLRHIVALGSLNAKRIIHTTFAGASCPEHPRHVVGWQQFSRPCLVEAEAD